MLRYALTCIRAENKELTDQSLKITLSSEQLAKLDKAAPFNPGFPAAFFGNDPHFLPEGKPDSALVNVVCHSFYLPDNG
jgi:hypothetical protein